MSELSSIQSASTSAADTPVSDPLGNRPKQSRGSEWMGVLEKERERGWRAARTPLLLAASLLVMEWLGARSQTDVLSGTVPPTVGAVLGLIYVRLWLSFVIVVVPWLAAVVADWLIAVVSAQRAIRRSDHDERAVNI